MARKTTGGNAAFHNFHNDYVHIEDPNERRRLALAEIDKAPFGWYHVRAIVVAGIGFFTDAYDIFAINLVTAMLGVVFWNQNKGIIPPESDTAIKVATSGGTVLGQVGFGILADVLGRKKMYGLELILIIICTLAVGFFFSRLYLCAPQRVSWEGYFTRSSAVILRGVQQNFTDSGYSSNHFLRHHLPFPLPAFLSSGVS